MNVTEKHACEILQKAFCFMRYFATKSLNDDGKYFLKLVADAAHNIPMSLAGDPHHAPLLEGDVAKLEIMISEPYEIIFERYALTTPTNVVKEQIRIMAFIGFTLFMFFAVFAGILATITGTGVLWNIALNFVVQALSFVVLYPLVTHLNIRGLWSWKASI